MFAYLVAAALFGIVLYSRPTTKSNVPLLNPRHWYEWTDNRAKQYFIKNSKSMIEDQFAKTPDRPFRVISDTGVATVLPPCLAHEIRNDPRLNFGGFTKKAAPGHIPGFEGFRDAFHDNPLIHEITIRDLTKELDKVTGPVSEEAEVSLSHLFGESSEWHALPLTSTVFSLITRTMARVFLGPELCRNDEWHAITKKYSTDVYQASFALRDWPVALHSVVHWFLTPCQNARADVQRAREIIAPVLEQRRKYRKEAEAGKKDVPQYNDAMEWIERAAKGQPYDAAITQLTLSVVAVHNTTDLFCQVLIDLAKNTDMLEPLRDEIKTVIKDHGWKKTALYHLKLLDSVIKESQRMKPMLLAAMRRVALEDVTLSDGTILPKGDMVAVSTHNMRDPNLYPDPDKWDGRRFIRIRETVPGKENAAQLVTTTPEHLGFGHGYNACPGRFFAANEMKIILVHLLLKYEWRLAPDTDPKPIFSGFSIRLDQSTQMEFRRRYGDEGILKFMD
ncbi:cytochrome P450 [Aspergillus terreus]|uniref:Cytochrome P450 n=1 Tax=Aspergillus terreus TaxID=33178 RepID=A0A5M3ZB87_ASPTE|nr:hypothetical protein ATETN484_0013033500 [Aspergillus terreus]GFF20569.1 cytochrome P450 [Aspergillus terreus]